MHISFKVGMIPEGTNAAGVSHSILIMRYSNTVFSPPRVHTNRATLAYFGNLPKGIGNPELIKVCPFPRKDSKAIVLSISLLFYLEGVITKYATRHEQGNNKRPKRRE